MIAFVSSRPAGVRPVARTRSTTRSTTRCCATTASDGHLRGQGGSPRPCHLCLRGQAHGSSVAIIVSTTAGPASRLPAQQHSWAYRHVRPEFAPAESLVALAESWLTQLSGQGPNREWAYRHVPRRIRVEELLVRADGAVPDDYKFFVWTTSEPIMSSQSMTVGSTSSGRTSSASSPRVPSRSSSGRATPGRPEWRGSR